MQPRTFQSLKKYFEILICLWIILDKNIGCSKAFAQSISNQDKDCCQKINNYLPDVYTSPVRVRICLHILQKFDGTGNFTTQDYDKIYRVFNDANGRFAHPCPMQLPTTSAFVPDAQIRLVLDTTDIFFHADDYDWDLFCSDKLYDRMTRVEMLYHKYVLCNARMPRNAVHYFWGEGYDGLPGKAPSQGVAHGIGSNRWICQVNVYEFMKQENHWLPGSTFAHELGHAFGLYHTVERGSKFPVNDQCDDTPTYPINTGCWNGDSCSNNLMDYSAGRCALTECQIARMHYHLSGVANHSIAQAVIPDWQQYQPPIPIIIPEKSNIIWKNKRFLQQDIVIEKDASLTIYCLTHLPPAAKIIIKRGGKLIIDSGEITCLTNGKWGGIRNHYKNKKNILFFNDGKLTQVCTPMIQTYSD